MKVTLDVNPHSCAGSYTNARVSLRNQGEIGFKRVICVRTVSFKAERDAPGETWLRVRTGGRKLKPKGDRKTSR